MRLTKSIVDWLIEKGICEPNGSREYYEHNAGRALAEGTLSPTRYKRLVTEDEFVEFEDGFGGSKSADDTDDDDEKFVPAHRFKSFVQDVGDSLKDLKKTLADEADKGDDMTEKLFSGRNSGHIRVKSGSEQYSTKTYAAKNKHGLAVMDPIYGGECQTQSEAAKAHAGCLFKSLAAKAGLGIVLGEHEKDLLDDMAMKHTWAGSINGEYSADIGGGRGIKALLDDSTSGGLEITPIWFDQDIVTFPLLNGELFPQVDVHEVPRGRRIEGASIGNPTMQWGGGDDSSITPFNTASLVAALDTTIFAVDCAILIGRDFLSDSAVNVGQVLTELVGNRLQTELDKVIGTGNGTTQPQGLNNAAGAIEIACAKDATGAVTLSDWMNLLFGLGKAYRTPQNNVCFISNDTTFQRSRRIKIDPAAVTTDQRPVFDPLMSNQGSFVNSYSTLGWQHKVQNDIGNATAYCVALKKYRMYRRLGLDLQFYREGATLAKSNEVLLVARARYGGRLMDPNALCKWTNGQA